MIEIFERDLNNLKKEINLYKDESKLWVVKDEITNSAENLCLHLLGNLNHFVGATLGNSGYIRDRESEFILKNASREDLNKKIDETIEAVNKTLQNLTDEDFENDFPLEFYETTVKTDFMLLHLLTHFNYHLGQVNYHRRLIS